MYFHFIAIFVWYVLPFCFSYRNRKLNVQVLHKRAASFDKVIFFPILTCTLIIIVLLSITNIMGIFVQSTLFYLCVCLCVFVGGGVSVGGGGGGGGGRGRSGGGAFVRFGLKNL